jgi:hypothetical protein
MKIFRILFTVFVVSCSSNSIQKEPVINGLVELEIKGKYGEPTHETILSLTKNKPLLEYQSDLYDVMHKLNIGDTLLVKEMYWEGEKKNKVVWLKKVETKEWLSFDNLQWSKDVKF